MPGKIQSHIINQIDNEEMISFLQKLVQSNSENPPGNEEHTADLIAKELDSFGCKTRLQYVEQNRPNIIGVMEGTHPEKLLFNGHTDTVKVGNLENWTVWIPLGPGSKMGTFTGVGPVI
jgi:succinyl-diaminopimelate desuccinylase